jgi:hypothetical protein
MMSWCPRLHVLISWDVSLLFSSEGDGGDNDDHEQEEKS